MKKIYFILMILFLSANSACENKENLQESNYTIKTQSSVKIPENLIKAIKAIEPFFKVMGEPSQDEWLASFKEGGQTFEQYINNNPTLPTAERRTLYIQPIGKFNRKQLEIIQITAEFMQKFFNLPVKLLPEKKFEEPLSLKNYRINQFSKIKQIRTGYVLEEILQPNLSEDAAALIAFTNEDLFPDKNFNYVFGQASLENRVGIWSLFRLGDDADFEKFLKRTLKVAVHETGHMFSISHCTKYECVMSGTNHLGETDKRPIDACPECMAKICWMSDYEPRQRYENLAEFCKKHNLQKDYDEFNKKLIAVSKN